MSAIIRSGIGRSVVGLVSRPFAHRAGYHYLIIAVLTKSLDHLPFTFAFRACHNLSPFAIAISCLPRSNFIRNGMRQAMGIKDKIGPFREICPGRDFVNRKLLTSLRFLLGLPSLPSSCPPGRHDTPLCSNAGPAGGEALISPFNMVSL